MKLFLLFFSITVFCSFSFSAEKTPRPVNDKCPYSGKAVNAAETVVFKVCCGNCAKKAAKDVKAFVGKAKAGVKSCPFSGKPAKKNVVVAFCCSKCKGKASS